MEELPNYYGSFLLNNLFLAEFEDQARPLIFSMLRNLAQAIREYRIGRDLLAEFANARVQSNDAITLYLRALTHFEHVIIHSDLAIGLSHGVPRCVDASIPKKHFQYGDNSPEERLRSLYNSLKHFDGTVVQKELPPRAAPVWIVPVGVRCVAEDKAGKPPIVTTLQFEEIVSILNKLADNALFLAEKAYRPLTNALLDADKPCE